MIVQMIRSTTRRLLERNGRFRRHCLDWSGKLKCKAFQIRHSLLTHHWYVVYSLQYLQNEDHATRSKVQEVGNILRCTLHIILFKTFRSQSHFLIILFSSSYSIILSSFTSSPPSYFSLFSLLSLFYLIFLIFLSHLCFSLFVLVLLHKF
jgi:hypothetical protein